VAAGEEIVIARAGEPVAKLVPVAAPQRQLGEDQGVLTVPDDFDDPLPDDVPHLYLSAASAWEIAIKYRVGKLLSLVRRSSTSPRG
jgi:hypothetical protein